MVSKSQCGNFRILLPQILREINFGYSEAPKTACHLDDFSSSEFQLFGNSWYFQVSIFPKKSNSKLRKLVTWQFLTFWYQSKSISRDFRGAVKLLNFHTVEYLGNKRSKNSWISKLTWCRIRASREQGSLQNSHGTLVFEAEGTTFSWSVASTQFALPPILTKEIVVFMMTL